MENENGVTQEATPAPETQEASTQAEATNTPAEGVTSVASKPAEKMFAQSEVNRLIQERVNELNARYKPYEQFGKPDELSQKLARLSQIEKEQSQKPPEPLTPEEKQLQDWLTKRFPLLAKQDDILKQIQEVSGTTTQLAQMTQRQRIQAGEESLSKMCEDAGIKGENQKRWVMRMVDMSLASKPEDRAAFYERGDLNVLKAHYDAVKSEFLDSFKKAEAATYSETKQKTSKLPPKMPAGGVGAPVSKTEKLTPKQLADKAFERLQELDKGS